jgi:hypothetical protein
MCAQYAAHVSLYVYLGPRKTANGNSLPDLEQSLLTDAAFPISHGLLLPVGLRRVFFAHATWRRRARACYWPASIIYAPATVFSTSVTLGGRMALARVPDW